MTTRLWILLEKLRSSYWFVPGLMTVAATFLSFATVRLDHLLTDRALDGVVLVYAGGPAGGRAVLSTIAGSTITVAGVLFSITIVTLSQASSQFGPRLLRTFMRDTMNQVVLGAFVSTFLYCLLVLRTVRDADGEHFVPHISITLGVGLAVLNLGMLIYFVHHVSVSIQAMNIVYAVSRDLRQAIGRLFPEKIGERAEDAAPKPIPLFEDEGRPIRARDGGYLCGVDGETLLTLAREHNLVLRLEHRPGHFIVEGAVLVSAWPGERLQESTARSIRQAFVMGLERTTTQDVQYLFDQLVEVGVRALSPGINDPFTAVACLDRLGEALVQLAGRILPSPYRHDTEGALRIVAPVVSFVGVVDSVFNPFRQYGHESVVVTLRLLETVTTVARHLQRVEDADALRAQVEAITADKRDWVEKDLQDFEERRQLALEVLDRMPAPEWATAQETGAV